MTRPVCPDCGHIHTSGDTIAVDRFEAPTAKSWYRADYLDSPLRRSREAAEADMCRWRKAQR